MEKYERVESVANRLRKAMNISGKSQADLVRETGIGKSNLSRYITGKFDPKSDTVYKLATALGVSEMWLWGCDVPMERPDEIKKEQPIEFDGLSEKQKDFMEKVRQMSDDQLDRLDTILSLVENTK